MYNGFAIALAWPETRCKRAGAWYDYPMHYLGISQQGYYRVGHAAVVLVDSTTKKCHYFDFGRYHTPHGYGRVRSAKTDHDLTIETKAIFSTDGKGISNLNEILHELHQNKSTHGTGAIYGTTTKIDFDASIEFANTLQEKDFLPYGPFIPNGTNCSRFVKSMILAGRPALSQKIKLTLPIMISPTPMWNLKAIGGELNMIGFPDESILSSKINPGFKHKDQEVLVLLNNHYPKQKIAL